MAPKQNAKTLKSSVKAGMKTGLTSGKVPADTSGPPQWPALSPLVPAHNLEFETVLEEQILVIRKFFTSALCQRYVSFLSGLPLTTTPGQPKKGNAVRVNDRFQVQDPAFSKLLWEGTALKELVAQSEQDWNGSVCGLNPNIRIYRYKQGHFFDQHYDESNNVMLEGETTMQAKTTWTLLIYLTGPATGCVGGETVFYPEGGSAKGTKKKGSTGLDPVSVAPDVGLALLHKHGDDCLLHEGKMVEAGEKWIIRSDLCVRR